MHDALASKGDISVHCPPTLGAKRLHWQHLACRLLAGTAAGLLFGIGVGTDQRRQVLEQQLVRYQVAGQSGPWLAGNEGQVPMDIAVADLAVEALVIERRPLRRLQVGA
ncbi:hypothetical protein D9M71_738080 [compost metagenome]